MNIKKNERGTTRMSNVIGYIRVSTDNQCKEDKFGLDVQKEQIERYCAENGMEIIKWYEDRGESGAKERPGFDEIVYGDVGNPPYEAVVVAKSDRVARDIEIYYYYKMMLRKKNVALISISEDFGKFGVFADMLESFTLCVAKMERENINKRTSAGRGSKAKEGGYAGGRVPFGYKAKDKNLVIIEEEAECVRIMFDMSEKGNTLQSIADKMNSMNMKTHFGKSFITSTVQTILANRKTYEGYYKYGKSEWIKGQHEAILKGGEKE